MTVVGNIPISLLRDIQLAAFDFDGVFTDNFVYVTDDGHESVRCSRLDGIGVSRLLEVDVYPVIISSEKNSVVRMRAEKLGIDCLQGVKDKRRVITELSVERGISLERTLFLGNDINDLPALRTVGLSVAVADAVTEILPEIKMVTKKKGGNGAVREVCDLIWRAKRGLDPDD